MSQIIAATFEDGVLKPEGALELAPGTKVRLVVDVWEDMDGDDPSTELDRLCEEFPIQSDARRMTRDQLHERR